MKHSVFDTFESCPVIAAVRDEAQLERSLVSPCEIVFLLFGDICTIAELAERAKKAGKCVFIHVDLMAGLGQNRIAADFVRQITCADGIISTQPALLKRAGELQLETILRFFALDSRAVLNLEKSLAQHRPDFIEILPGVLPRTIRYVCEKARIPVIAGGLISAKEDVIQALAAGATSVSSSCEKVWLQ